ncbi:hypothetical protein IS481_14835 [Caldimonas thermodepolymerans]|uniref:hypothetical protein n=1 Tax=Caldimonas thermodepolymerans TaxID=215580 RepID=UPI0011AFDAFD|nr:hypothetical protein [Caldimonas thermodepolymerans]QPC30998.1 hypothetical protein IS481_14835 [Caldimonas thermodepolymerans]
MLAALAAYKNVLVAAVVGVLAVVSGLQTLRLERARTELATVRGHVLSLETRIAAQAASLARLKAEAERREAESSKALAAAQRALSTAQARADALQKSRVPEDCAGAVGWAADRGPVLGAW